LGQLPFQSSLSVSFPQNLKRAHGWLSHSLQCCLPGQQAAADSAEHARQLLTNSVGERRPALHAENGAPSGASFIFDLLLFAATANQPHDVRGRPSGSQFIRHELHVWVDMPEKMLITRAEIIQSVFPVGCLCKPVLRALPIAGKSHIAFSTHARQRIPLRIAKCFLLRRSCQLLKRTLHNVAQPVFRIHKVIA
jgi:hypothetical protein